MRDWGKTLSRRYGVLLAVLIVIGVLSPAVNAQHGRSSLVLRLSVEEELLKTNRLRVTCEFSNVLYLSELRLALGPSQTRRFYPIGIEFLKAVDSKGQTLKVDREPQASPDSPEIWSVKRSVSDSFQIEYLVELDYYAKDLVNGYLGYASPRYVVSWAGWIFLLPVEYQWRSFDGLIQVNISAPLSWAVVAPWEKQSDGSYIDRDYYHFQRSTFGVGPYDVRSKLVKGTLVTVAMDSGFDSRSRDLLGNHSFATFEYVFNLFRAKILERYLVIYVTPPEPRLQLIGLLEASDSQGIGFAGTFEPGLIGEFEHRVFHTWNGFPPFGMNARSNEELWFIEGTDVYYEKVTCVLGIIDASSFLQYVLRFYLNEIVGKEYDIPLSQANMNQPYPLWRLPYWKGALVSFMLDELIRKVSGGTHSLDDVLAMMYERYGRMRGVYSNRDILRVLNSLTACDFDLFFAKYIYGNERLPLKISQGKVSVDWPELLQALKLSRIPLMTLSLVDSSPRVGQTAELKASLISVDGKPIVNQTIIFHLNSATIGSSVTDHSGLATFTFKVGVKPGKYEIVAYYAGSSIYSESRETIQLTVMAEELSVTTARATLTSTTRVATESSGAKIAWVQSYWPYLALVFIGVAIVMVLVMHKLRSAEQKPATRKLDFRASQTLAMN